MDRLYLLYRYSECRGSWESSVIRVLRSLGYDIHAAYGKDSVEVLLTYDDAYVSGKSIFYTLSGIWQLYVWFDEPSLWKKEGVFLHKIYFG